MPIALIMVLGKAPGFRAHERCQGLAEILFLATGRDRADQRRLRIRDLRQLRGLLLGLFRSELVPVLPEDQHAVPGGQLGPIPHEVKAMPYRFDLVKVQPVRLTPVTRWLP